MARDISSYDGEGNVVLNEIFEKFPYNITDFLPGLRIKEITSRLNDCSPSLVLSHGYICIFIGTNDTYARDFNILNFRDDYVEFLICLKTFFPNFQILCLNLIPRILSRFPKCISNRRISKMCRCLTCKPFIEMSIDHFNHRIVRLNDVIYDICREFCVNYIDIFSKFRASNDIYSLYKWDGLHPARCGKELIIKELVKHI